MTATLMSVVRRAPFTIGFLALMWATAIATGSLDRPSVGHVAVGVHPLTHGQWWTPLTSLLWCGSLAGYLVTTVLVVAVCGPVERRLGGARTLLIFVLTHVAGTVVGVALVAAGADLGEWWLIEVADTVTVGPSTAVVGIAAAATARCSPMWRGRLRMLLFVILGTLVLYSGQLPDVLHLLTAVAGLVVGPALAGRDAGVRPSPPRRPDSRVLLALICAAFAVGPLVAAMSGSDIGPLSVLRYAVPPIVSVVLLVLAEGLRRGRWLAWWAVLVVNAALAWHDTLTTLPTLLMLWLLIANRRSFVRRGRPCDGGGGAARARRMLVEHGGSELSYMTTWRGNSYWFSADGRVVIAYRVVGSVALTVGDPIGENASLPGAVREFVAFCVDNGWTPCLYSVTEEFSGPLRTMGWHLVQVAEETRLPLADLAFTGRKWQDVRTALNKAKRSGMVAESHRYRDAPADIADQIRAISREWLAGKGLPEMGFTLGGLPELRDDDVRCLIAVDADRTVHAVTSWMPVYRDGRIAGWTLDFMRRSTGSGNGIMEFLIAAAIMMFKAEGAEFVSLSAAPLARLDTGRQVSVLERLLDRVGRTLEPVYGFRSLLAFKTKFQPVHRPLYLAYPSAVALPGIGGAIAHAYLPDLTVAQAVRLAGRVLLPQRTPVVRAPAPPALETISA